MNQTKRKQIEREDSSSEKREGDERMMKKTIEKKQRKEDLERDERN